MERKQNPLIYIPIILFGVFLFGFYKINITVHFPNEISYWANAASLLGTDWAGIASRYSYFSFGYSFLLVPLMKWIGNPIVLYKTAILLNVFMACFHGIMLYRVLKRMFPNREEGIVKLITLIGAVYPSIIFYINVTLPEIMLNLLIVVTIYLLYGVFEESGKFQLYLLILLWSLLYFVHMRTVGILMAGAIVLLFFYVSEKKTRKYWLVLGGILVLLGSGYFLKLYLEGNLYTLTSKSTLAVNDYSGQLGKIKGLFTLSGIHDLAMSLIGKLYYLGIATFGTFYWGVFSLVKKSLKKDKVSVYILLSVGFSFMIHAFYMSGSSRIDTLMYGRYNEMFIPIMVCIGLLEMLNSSYVLRGCMAQIMGHSVMTMLLYNYIFGKQLETFFGHYVVGFIYFVSGNEPTVGELIKGTYLSGSVFSLLLASIVLLYQKRKRYSWGLGIFVGIYVVVGISACYRYQIYTNQEDAHKNMELAYEIENITSEHQTILFLDQEKYRDVDYLQFCMPKKPFVMKSEKNISMDELEADYFVITYWDSEHAVELKSYYTKFIQKGYFNCYYNN